MKFIVNNCFSDSRTHLILLLICPLMSSFVQQDIIHVLGLQTSMIFLITLNASSSTHSSSINNLKHKNHCTLLITTFIYIFLKNCMSMKLSALSQSTVFLKRTIKTYRWMIHKKFRF